MCARGLAGLLGILVDDGAGAAVGADGDLLVGGEEVAEAEGEDTPAAAPSRRSSREDPGGDTACAADGGREYFEAP